MSNTAPSPVGSTIGSGNRRSGGHVTDSEHDEQAEQEESQLVDVGDTPDPSDPFAGWPAAESSSVIEQAPPDGGTVEHVRGEIDVPDGYAVLEGTPLGERRTVGVVVSRFNGGITNAMLKRALEALDEAGVARESITVMP